MSGGLLEVSEAVDALVLSRAHVSGASAFSDAACACVRACGELVQDPEVFLNIYTYLRERERCLLLRLLLVMIN